MNILKVRNKFFNIRNLQLRLIAVDLIQSKRNPICLIPSVHFRNKAGWFKFNEIIIPQLMQQWWEERTMP